MPASHLHLDCPSGISGDMFCAALLHLGVPLSVFQEAITALHLPEKVILKTEKAVRGGLAGLRFLVEETGPHHHQDHDHQHGRNWAEIRDLLKNSKLPREVHASALAMFQRVAEAEAKLHGVPVETVHFHEVGAVDSIVDLVCAAAGVHHLKVGEITATTPVEGTGTIQCAHGKFPLPAPATAEILRGIPIRQIDVPHELTTPTGAAILAQFVRKFALLESFAADLIGYGLGTRDLPDRPNVLRAFLGHISSISKNAADTVFEIRTHLDDITGEHLAHAIDRLMAEGALDAAVSPLVMKKGRSGQLLTVLALPADAEKLAAAVLRETTAFGLRMERVERRTLSREEKVVQTAHGSVRVKLGYLGDKLVQIHPEDDDCRRLAKTAKLSPAEISAQARSLCR